MLGGMLDGMKSGVGGTYLVDSGVRPDGEKGIDASKFRGNGASFPDNGVCGGFILPLVGLDLIRPEPKCDTISVKKNVNEIKLAHYTF